MDGSFIYIMDNPRRDMIYIEGSYDADFKDYIKYICRGTWQPSDSRWAVPRTAYGTIGGILDMAKRRFDKVYYSGGGDYEIL